MAVSYVSREQIQVHRFNPAVTVGVPLAALVLQAFIPVRLHWFSIFDLPLLVTIFFAVSRRNPIGGLATGCIIGLLQDSLTHNPLGLYGIAKTVVGFAASSLGVKIDVDNPGSRLLVTFGFYLVHQFIYLFVVHGLVGQDLDWRWSHLLLAAFFNAALAVVLFFGLDHLKQTG